MVQVPGVVHDGAVLRPLGLRGPSRAPRAARVRLHREDVRRSVGELNAALREGELEELPRDIAEGVVESLLVRRHRRRAGEVVGAEVCGPAASVRRRHEAGRGHPPVWADERLRRLDHEIDRDRARLQVQPLLQAVERPRQHGHLVRAHDLGEEDEEPVRRPLAGGPQRGQEEIQRPQRPTARHLRQRLEADAQRGRQPSVRDARRRLVRRRARRRVLLLARTRPEAVLEVDQEALDGLARELLAYPGVHDIREPGGQCAAQRVAEAARIAGVAVQIGTRDAPQLRRRVASEEMRAPGDRVYGLPPLRVPRVAAAVLRPRALEAGEQAGDFVRGEGEGRWLAHRRNLRPIPVPRQRSSERRQP